MNMLIDGAYSATVFAVIGLCLYGVYNYILPAFQKGDK